MRRRLEVSIERPSASAAVVRSETRTSTHPGRDARAGAPCHVLERHPVVRRAAVLGLSAVLACGIVGCTGHNQAKGVFHRRTLVVKYLIVDTVSIGESAVESLPQPCGRKIVGRGSQTGAVKAPSKRWKCTCWCSVDPRPLTRSLSNARPSERPSLNARQPASARRPEDRQRCARRADLADKRACRNAEGPGQPVQYGPGHDRG